MVFILWRCSCYDFLYFSLLASWLWHITQARLPFIGLLWVSFSIFLHFNPKLTHKLYSQLILISFLLLYQLNCLVDLLFQFAQIYFSWNLLSRLFSGEICFKCSLILLLVNSLRLRFLILWISASYYYFEDMFYSLDCESRCIEPPAKSQSLDWSDGYYELIKDCCWPPRLWVVYIFSDYCLLTYI